MGKSKRRKRPEGPRDIELLNVVGKNFGKQENRGLVLVGGAVVDRALERLIRAKLETLSNATKEEVDFFLTEQPVPPLGSAAIRARFARIIGALDSSFCEACKELFNLRNEFAHEEYPRIFSKELLLPIWEHIPRSVREDHKSRNDMGHPGGFDALTAEEFFELIIWVIVLQTFEERRRAKCPPDPCLVAPSPQPQDRPPSEP